MKIIISSIAILLFCLPLHSQNKIMLLKSSGKVVIGDTTQITTPGDYSLYVQNGILTERVKVSLASTGDWSDHAFFNTPELKEVADHIKSELHLIDMPSAEELVKEGYDIQDMDAKLLQQIEWLWQHMIELKKENEALKAKLLEIEQE